MRAKEFIEEYIEEGDVVSFKRSHPMDARTDMEKYYDAVQDQEVKKRGYDPLDVDTRSTIGHEECPYCGNEWCNYDCDEAQASGFTDDVEEGNVENAKALVGSGLGGNTHKPNIDSKYLKSVRTPTTNYPKDRAKYNNGAKPGANPGFVGG